MRGGLSGLPFFVMAEDKDYRDDDEISAEVDDADELVDDMEEPGDDEESEPEDADITDDEDGIEDKEMVEISSESDTGDVSFKFHIGDKESAPQDRAGAVSVLESVDGFTADDEPIDVDALLDEAEDTGSVEFWVSPEDREKIEGWMI